LIQIGEYAILAIVDFACAFYMCTFFNGSLIENYVLYNFFAFAFQVPLGVLLDKHRNYQYIGLLGTLLILLIYVVQANETIIIPCILGIGNALFHLEGGINVYEISKPKSYLNGIFVAPRSNGNIFRQIFVF